MKKSNLLQTAIATALMAMAGSASATTTVSATSVAYATEQFLGSTPYAAVVAPSINVVPGVAIPAGSTITVMVQLAGGVFGVTQTWDTAVAGGNANMIYTATAGSGVSANVTMGSTTGSTIGVCSSGSSTCNSDVVAIRITTVSAVGIGGTLLTLNTPTISAAGLASTSAAVTATATILSGSVTTPAGAAFSTSAALEGASAGTFATSKAGITVAAAANTSTAKIDLTAATPSTLFTTTTASATETGTQTKVFKLGTIKVTDGTAKLVTASNNAYNTSAQAKTLVATITAPSGFLTPLGTSGTITLNALTGNACTAAASSTSATFASGAAATATSIAMPAFAPATGMSYDICMNVDGKTAVTTGQPAVSATLGAAAAQDSAETLASTSLQTLSQNGSQVDVRNYVPAGVTGYQSWVRVINTGTVSAAISIALIDATTGSAGTAKVMGTLAAGAAVNYSSSDVENATTGLGAITATSRPRIRVTAPTNGLQVQSFLAAPGGLITDMTGAQ